MGARPKGAADPAAPLKEALGPPHPPEAASTWVRAERAQPPTHHVASRGDVPIPSRSSVFAAMGLRRALPAAGAPARVPCLARHPPPPTSTITRPPDHPASPPAAALPPSRSPPLPAPLSTHRPRSPPRSVALGSVQSRLVSTTPLRRRSPCCSTTPRPTSHKCYRLQLTPNTSACAPLVFVGFGSVWAGTYNPHLVADVAAVGLPQAGQHLPQRAGGPALSQEAALVPVAHKEPGRRERAAGRRG